MMKGLKDFLLRGNAIDLAVGAIIGAMFGDIVTALTKGFIEPLIAGIVGKPNFDSVLVFAFGQVIDGKQAELKIGLILTAVFNFALKGAVIYFFIVSPMKKALERAKKSDAPAAPPPPPAQEVLLGEIRDLLKAKA